MAAYVIIDCNHPGGRTPLFEVDKMLSPPSPQGHRLRHPSGFQNSFDEFDLNEREEACQELRSLEHWETKSSPKKARPPT